MRQARAIVAGEPRQREVLRQALTDAIYYSDPPLCCPACPAPDRPSDPLCDECAAGLDLARAYLALSRALGLGP